MVKQKELELAMSKIREPRTSKPRPLQAEAGNSYITSSVKMSNCISVLCLHNVGGHCADVLVLGVQLRHQENKTEARGSDEEDEG